MKQRPADATNRTSVEIALRRHKEALARPLPQRLVVTAATMGSGAGPNSGGGRRSGGGGHQSGQGEMAARKLKAAKAKEERNRARGGSAGGRDGGRGGKGGRDGDRGDRGGRGGRGPNEVAEQVSMTASNQQLVSGLLAKACGGSFGNGSSGDLLSTEVRIDVDPEDVERKSWQTLEKKGFDSDAVSRALKETEPSVHSEGDRREAFNEQKRRRVHRALDWLILNLDEGQLPETFHEEARSQRAKHKGKKKKTQRDNNGDDGAPEVNPVTLQIANALTVAGFPAQASFAAATASDSDQWRALGDLCSALGPDRATAMRSAIDALAEAGAGDLDEQQAIDILKTAQVDELTDLPRDKHAPRGYTPGQSKALFQFEIPGIVQLGAKQYSAKLEIDITQRDAYPFELPEMKFTHPTLQFPEAAAVNASLHRFAVSLIGEPFLEQLLEWCEGDDVVEAVEKAREAMRESVKGAIGTPGIAAGGHLSRTFSKLELDAKAAEAEEERAAARRKQLMEINAREAAGGGSGTSYQPLKASSQPFLAPKTTVEGKKQTSFEKTNSPVDSPQRPSQHAPSAEERLAATERRRQLKQEQTVLSAAQEAERQKTEAGDASARTARAAAEIAKAEQRAASDSRLVAESEKMRLELENRMSETNSDASLRRLIEQRKRLPAWAKSTELLDAVKNNQVTIVAGETGCGKTTQLPQFILDDAIANGNGARTNLICTQPRRISATSVAARVAQERGEPIGKTIGYKIRLESVASSSTKILFVTTGVLLRRLAEDPLLSGVSHVVVDEVHERSMDSDFLLVLLRDVLPHRPSLRIVLMSATLNASAFSAYFKGAAVAQIPGFTFPVQEHYLEDILQVTSYVPSGEYLKRGGYGSSTPSTSDRTPGEYYAPDAKSEQKFLDDLNSRGYTQNTRDALRSMDQSVINYNLAAKLIEHICVDMAPGAILVFMPGLAEITKLHEMCANNQKIRNATGGAKYLIGLHSSLSTAEQKVIFEHPPNDARKIVIATNIAETSITIDDVVYVVDTGKCKENGYDPNTRMQLLLERWVSRASAKQRRGRAGRVAAGRCFRLYTRLNHDVGFCEHTLPEIKRVPLEGLCLQIQLQKMAGGIAGFLGKALEPPKEDSVTSAIKTLKQIGALNEKENLTPLGQHLAVLPVDVRVGKMLLYGAVLGCLSPVLTIAAVLGGRAPFVAPLDKRDEADAAKKLFAEDQSDHLTSLNAFNAWIDAKQCGKQIEMQFTRENFLSFRTLEGIADLRNQFCQLLQEAGFLGGGGGKGGRGGKNIPMPKGVGRGAGRGGRGGGQTQKPWGRKGPPPDDPVWLMANRNSGNTRLVKAVLVAGLYPNLIKATASHRPGAPPKLTYLSEQQKEEQITVHPSSVNYSVKKFSTKWLVYHERVQTTSVFARDCSTVTPYQLLLFGGKIAVQHAAGTLSVDKWAQFKAPARVGVLLKEIRQRLEKVLSDKIEKPEEDFRVTGGPLVEAILQLLNTEPATAAPS